MSSRALRVAIVGGGIGGAAAANALLQRGLDVQVYEQASALMHRADLLGMLVDRLPAGIVKTGHRCVGFEQDDEQATVSFANGARATADVVVGADGIHSALQPYVVEPSPPISSGSMAYRGIIPAASVDWPSGAQRHWLGGDKRLMVYPVRANQLLNCVAFMPMDEQMKESWSAPGDPAALVAEFAGWDPLVERVLAQVQTCFRWGVYDREPLPAWTNGRLTLLGDAAHPMVPHAGQGANQAIEDGVALATILARADRASVPRALRIYEAVRRERTSRVQAMSRTHRARFAASHTGDTQERRLRSESMDRAWLANYDAEAEAAAALASF